MVSAASRLRIILLTWLFVATAVGESGVLTRLPGPGLQAILFGLTLIVIAAYRSWITLYEWVSNVNVRWMVSFHLTRFIGIYFLYLYERGDLPFDFAVKGGWGDIVVAILAVVLLITPTGQWFRKLLLFWNTLGLLDIVYVVLTAGRLNVEEPGSMSALTHLPLSLLPTFLVPIIIATHLFIFIRLSRAGHNPALLTGQTQ